jgi:hypothetical protein
MIVNLLPRYTVAVDLGQVNDYTAIAVAERSPGLSRDVGSYDVIHLQRLPLGTPYTALPDHLGGLEQFVRRRWTTLAAERHRAALPLARAPVELVVDQTGVGRPVVDLLRQAGFAPIAITITGGDQVIQVAHREYRVPKRNLAAAVQVLLQTRRLRWATSLPEAVTLKAELNNFKAKISLSGHDSYGASADWREGNHDDLVLSVALGCWYGEYDASEAARNTTMVTSYLEHAEDDGDARRYWPAR